MPKNVHRNGRRPPCSARIRQLVRQPSEVRHAQRVTRPAQQTRAPAGLSREGADKGAAQAQVPEGGNGVEGEGRGVDLVVRIGKIGGAADACNKSHA